MCTTARSACHHRSLNCTLRPGLVLQDTPIASNADLSSARQQCISPNLLEGVHHEGSSARFRKVESGFRQAMNSFPASPRPKCCSKEPDGQLLLPLFADLQQQI